MVHRNWILAAQVVLTCVLTPENLSADPFVLECETSGITAVAKGELAAKTACDVAMSTNSQLRDLGLAIHQDVVIEITEDLDVAPETCVALYITNERKLQVLPVECLEDQPGRAKAFPEMNAELLFESLIVHELTHAYVDQSVEGQFMPRIAHEYLAYSIQLEALPGRERDRILAKAGVMPPVKLTDINEATLNLSPLRFAAMAWLHFHQEGGNAALVRRIIDNPQMFQSLRE